MTVTAPLMSIIVAVADNGVIGDGDRMVWSIKSELQYFKRTTMGKPLIHGRKSFAALGRPLPGRLNIVVTRQKDFTAEGVTVAHDLETAIDIARARAVADGVDEFFIAGGSEIYRQALPQADRLYMTEVHFRPEGKTLFPAFDRNLWQETSRIDCAALPGETAPYTLTVLTRVK